MTNSSIVFFTLAVLACSSCHQGGHDKPKQQTSPIDTQSSHTSDYSVVTPAGWTQEYHPFPLDFATDIPYKGYADVRFPPFWGNKISNQFWSYVNIWWLTDTPQLNEKTITRTLEQYYTGLASINRPGRMKPSDSASRAIAKVTRTEADSPDVATYDASASIYDGNVSMSRLDINLKIHVIPCQKGNATVVILEISPKDYSDSIWQTMDKIKSQFKCAD